MVILTPNGQYKFEGRDNDPDDEAVVKETWVEDIYQLHRGLLDDTGLFIDIGANIGAVAVFVATLSDEDEPDDKTLPKIRVIAFEPEPNNLELLYKNIKLNKKQDQISVIPYAIGAKHEIVSMTDGSGSAEMIPYEKGTDEIQCIRLEDVFADNKIASCDLLKMDVEGSEYDILINTPTDVLRKIQHIRLEFHKPRNLSDFGEMITVLAKVFNLHIIGTPDVGGNIYGSRY